VREKSDWLLLRGAWAGLAAIADDERGGLTVWDDVDVGLWETGGLEPGDEILRERRYLSEADGGSEGDGATEDLAGVGLVGREGRGRQRRSGTKRRGKDESQDEAGRTKAHEAAPFGP
jgi:hypothetical protein